MIHAINSKFIIELTFDSKEKGRITRTCVPFDIGPSRRSNDNIEKFHFRDLNSPDGAHTLSILPSSIKMLEVTNNHFNPADHITWVTNWHYPRDWGQYS